MKDMIENEEHEYRLATWYSDYLTRLVARKCPMSMEDQVEYAAELSSYGIPETEIRKILGVE